MPRSQCGLQPSSPHIDWGDGVWGGEYNSDLKEDIYGRLGEGESLMGENELYTAYKAHFPP